MDEMFIPDARLPDKILRVQVETSQRPFIIPLKIRSAFICVHLELWIQCTRNPIPVDISAPLCKHRRKLFQSMSLIKRLILR
ncbi:MAG: hypothetical protein C4530_17105 [Desulfobacteraceae bacterium]|nr:MAG: hypothetical protein C4530_17105 [Desulfobacteraceae bacterium]